MSPQFDNGSYRRPGIDIPFYEDINDDDFDGAFDCDMDWPTERRLRRWNETLYRILDTEQVRIDRLTCHRAPRARRRR